MKIRLWLLFMLIKEFLEVTMLNIGIEIVNGCKTIRDFCSGLIFLLFNKFILAFVTN